ncbi:MAG: hypothetical protein JOS17DRAFT_735050 [Linnemannia elongata]|nr:MAG: hypothetical protein JOS17DRAFT_735050 [Linnemannia elongata]
MTDHLICLRSRCTITRGVILFVDVFNLAYLLGFHSNRQIEYNKKSWQADKKVLVAAVTAVFPSFIGVIVTMG